MTGTEYMLYEVMEPHLFVIRKQKRDGPEKVTPMLTYYILDGSIYQAPQLCNVFAARIVSAFFFFLHLFSHSDILETLDNISMSALIGIKYASVTFRIWWKSPVS